MNILLESIANDLESIIDRKDLQYIYIGNPKQASNMSLEKGVCIIEPTSTSFIPITTGVQIQDTKNFKIIFAKSYLDDLSNSQIESGTEWLMRIMEGRNTDGSLKTDSGVYIVLRNLRHWGKLQTSVQINYDTEDIETTSGGIVQGNITIEQLDIFSLGLV